MSDLLRNPALEGLDEIEKDKVERPFGCGVGGCERRYKNMNGLRESFPGVLVASFKDRLRGTHMLSSEPDDRLH